MGDVGGLVTGGRHAVGEPLRLLPQRNFGAGGEQPRHDGVGPVGGNLPLLCGSCLQLILGRCLFEDDVRVGAAAAEGGDADAARPVDGGPFDGLGEQAQGAGGPVDVGVASSAWSDLGTMPCRRAATILMTPRMPEAAWV